MSEKLLEFEEDKKWRPRLTLLHLCMLLFSLGVTTGVALCFWKPQFFVPRYLAQEEPSGLAACSRNLGRMSKAFEAYHLDFGKYPLSQYELVPDYLAEIPTCPSAKRVSYRSAFGPRIGNNHSDSDDYYLIECCGKNHKRFWVKRNFPAYDNIQGLMMEQGR